MTAMKYFAAGLKYRSFLMASTTSLAGGSPLLSRLITYARAGVFVDRDLWQDGNAVIQFNQQLDRAQL
jgi:hypothetical protein